VVFYHCHIDSFRRRLKPGNGRRARKVTLCSFAKLLSAHASQIDAPIQYAHAQKSSTRGSVASYGFVYGSCCRKNNNEARECRGHAAGAKERPL
jgi:hypothetical protein